MVDLQELLSHQASNELALASSTPSESRGRISSATKCRRRATLAARILLGCIDSIALRCRRSDCRGHHNFAA